MNNAQIAAVKFGLCALIALFVVLAIMHIWPGGFIRPMLYVAGGGVCIGLLWPTQEQGDALINPEE